MTKTEAIAIFKRAGYTYTGYKKASWGSGYYHFTHPNIQGTDVSYDLALLRKRARHLDIKMWHDEYKAQLRAGIQQELFSPYEYLTE